MIFGKNPSKIQEEIDQLERDMTLAQGISKFAFLPIALSDGRWIWLENYAIFTRVFYGSPGMIIGGKEITMQDLDDFEDGPSTMIYATNEMCNFWYERVIYKKSLNLMSERVDELKKMQKYKG